MLLILTYIYPFGEIQFISMHSRCILPHGHYSIMQGFLIDKIKDRQIVFFYFLKFLPLIRSFSLCHHQQKTTYSLYQAVLHSMYSGLPLQLDHDARQRQIVHTEGHEYIDL